MAPQAKIFKRFFVDFSMENMICECGALECGRSYKNLKTIDVFWGFIRPPLLSTAELLVRGGESYKK